ncbi:hypothetical protein [Hymenobacter cheonanensis]|uniref:hypothetical protein n=1 Tax=Hymenobacter sp. CA2-7 TaxID=3063993 RepID=UPI002712D020|nr:hypothetical protein [Hymenobacter sp. CA2-7]MDO7885589.1 hypothetical protein [Hymenobacter sp. CA2-7]
MNIPRLRQLRRDKTLFTLAMNTIRLHLEEEDRLAQQPQLREAPDADLHLIQHSIDQWAHLATGYLMQKFKCPMPLAMQLLGELQNDLKMSVSVQELRQVPFTRALAQPRGPMAGEQPAVAEATAEAAPLSEPAQ